MYDAHGDRSSLHRGCGRAVSPTPGRRSRWQPLSVTWLPGRPASLQSSWCRTRPLTTRPLPERSLAERQREEEEAVEAAVLEAAVAEGRLQVELQRGREDGTRVSRQTWATLSRMEQLAVEWYLAKDVLVKRRVKKKKKAGGRYFFAPLHLAVTCLTSVLPEEYVCRFSGRCHPECFRILLLLVRVDTCLQWLLSSITVPWLVLLPKMLWPVWIRGTVMSVLGGSMVQKIVVVPQMQFIIVGRRHPLRSAEADPHGPVYSPDHRDSPVAVRFQMVDAPVVQVVLAMPVVVNDRCASSDSAEFRGGAAVAVSSTVMNVPVILQRRWVATLEVPQIQFIAGVG